MSESEKSRSERETGPSRDELAAAVPRAQAVHEARVGVFVLVGILAVVAALYVLTDPSWFRGRYMLTTTVVDVGGLRSGDPVQMRGVNIGRVHDFALAADGQVVIELEVEGEYRIPQGSSTTLVSNGLLQGRVVRINPGDSMELLESGTHIPGEIQPDIMQSVGELGPQASDVLTRVQALLSDSLVTSTTETVQELRTLLAELSSIVSGQRDEVQALTESLNRSATSLEAGIESFAGAAPDAAALIARSDSMVSRLSGTVDTMDSLLGRVDSIVARLDRGEGTLGKLLDDETLYESLVRATSAVDLLMTDIRLNPKRYLTIEIF